jgi:hypothetical protein
MAKQRKQADPFIVKGVEGSNDWPTEQEMLDGWREKLSKIVEKFKDEPPESDKGKQCIDAQAALIEVEILERVNNRAMCLGAAVKLGALFAGMGLRPIEPLITRGRTSVEAQRTAVEEARKANTKWTNPVDKKAREILSEIPASDTEESKALQIVAELWNRHKIKTSVSSVNRHLFNLKA